MTHPESNSPSPAFSTRSLWPIATGSLVAILGLGYGLRSGTGDREILTNQHTLSVSVHQLQSQVKDLSERLSAVNALQEKRAMVIEPAPVPTTPRPPVEKITLTQSSPKLASDVKELRRLLNEQTKQLAVTQQDLDKARQDLDTRFTGALARTNEELTQLRNRGQLDLHQFQLYKSKRFTRTGPVSLSLRKADEKHRRYDLDLMIDDVKLEKRNINLYEPITFRAGDQPIELVVNQVSKDKIKGYISVPKPQQARR